MTTLQQEVESMRPSNAIGEILIPFHDFLGDCEHLFEEEKFKQDYYHLLSTKGITHEQVIRKLLNHQQFGDMDLVYDEENDEEFVVEWEFE